MPPSSSFQCFTLTLLVLPAVILLVYFLTAFPHVPESLAIHTSLASLPNDCRSWQIYPEDIFPGGAYVNFPYGRVRYWLFGPEDGIKLVLIHGLSVPSLIWQDVAPQLAAKGFRVLVYDLYGRGYTDAPQTTYDLSLYTTQLALLLQHVGWPHRSANLVGVSMGGAVATAFAVQFPYLVTGKIALIATTGIVNSSDMSRTSRFLSSPMMQAIASSRPFRAYLRYLASSSSSSSMAVGARREEGTCDDESTELVRLQSAFLPGYNSAIASSIRNGPIRAQAPVFVALGRQTRKNGGQVVLLWGTKDTVVPYSYASRVQALLGGEDAGVQLVTLEGAAHDITTTHSAEVVDVLKSFFKQK